MEVLQQFLYWLALYHQVVINLISLLTYEAYGELTRKNEKKLEFL